MEKGHLLVLATAIASGCAVFYNASAVKGAGPVEFALAKNALTAFLLVGVILLLGKWREALSLSRTQ